MTWPLISKGLPRSSLALVLLLWITRPAMGVDGFAFPPVRYYGQLGFESRLFTGDFGAGETRTTRDQLLNLEVNAATFLWQPWFALLDGTLGLRFGITDSDGAQADTSSELISGKARLRLFPVGRFPFEAFYERSDSLVDVEDGVERDFLRTRYGLLQRYTTLAGTYYLLRLQHTDVQQTDSEDMTDLVEFRVRRSFKQHELEFFSFLTDIERVDTDERFSSDAYILRHRFFSQQRTLNVDNLISYNDNRSATRSVESTRTQTQLNSFLTWRPKTERRLLVTGNTRVFESSTEAGGESSDGRSAVFSVGANYQLTDRLNLSANVGANLFEAAEERKQNIFQTVAATYSSRTLPLGDFDYNWFGTASANNSTGDDNNTHGYGSSIGHNLSRGFALGNTQLNASVSQAVSYFQQSGDPSQLAADHGLSLNWSQQKENISTFTQLTFDDSRTFGEEEEVFQLINLQFSRNQRLDNYSGLSGNVSIQAARQTVDDTDTQSTDSGDWETNASINLSYNHQRLFGVPRLRFTSDLNYASDALLGLSERPDEFRQGDDLSWNNRLDYLIGRLEFRFQARLNQVDDRFRQLYIFNVTRHFGN